MYAFVIAGSGRPRDFFANAPRYGLPVVLDLVAGHRFSPRPDGCTEKEIDDPDGTGAPSGAGAVADPWPARAAPDETAVVHGLKQRSPTPCAEWGLTSSTDL